MKQFLSILIGVVIIVAIAFFALRSSPATAPEVVQGTIVPTNSPESAGEGYVQVAPDVPASTAPSAVAISIEDEGFTPATVTVPVGTTVTFTNNGQALHWPASDPHPVHTDLSAFDAKKGLATGETYSFTFTKPGTFGMHDHLNARIKGTIVVQ